MIKKKKVASEPLVNNVDEIVLKVIGKLKPEMDLKLASIKNDLLIDVKEQIDKLSIKPNIESPVSSSPDISKIIESVTKGGDIDMSKISSLMGNMNPASPIDTSKLPAEKQMEMMKMQQQNQLMMMILPKLFEQPSQSPFMAEMMQRFFMENISDGMMQRKAFTNFAMKLAGDPALANQYAQMQSNVSSPITDALTKAPLGKGDGNNA